MNLWKNKKNQELYLVIGTLINATNSNDGEKMVLYSKNNKYFVREYNEFLLKFERIEESRDILEVTKDMLNKKVDEE
ncbi:MAG: hypothetical protein ACRC1R_03495 [Cetobacterium sp.]|uniref:hypothetical protein n=1 Tax=Cetobacterium sp. TaxID=2071632 RepID=UPI003F2ADD8F